eukprot:TRINITY_DN12218_c2_g1_i1.p1 TRINITY_DN12218_c2_g1~~TRINITY_DN12218_c2_g1_i1.p1  ORF type:complete len:113 (-),score=13.86 TRINITY_DN12218_c2_g1_i1:157-495(-)
MNMMQAIMTALQLSDQQSEIICLIAIAMYMTKISKACARSMAAFFEIDWALRVDNMTTIVTSILYAPNTKHTCPGTCLSRSARRGIDCAEARRRRAAIMARLDIFEPSEFKL